MIIATVINKNVKFFLRGTTWAFNVDRADKFDNSILAMAAVLKAKKFMHVSLFKKIIYEKI